VSRSNVMSRARDTCPIPPSPIAEVLVGAETGAGRESECGAIRRAGRPCGRDYTCKTPIWRQPADTPECPRVGLSSGTQAEMQLVAEDHRPQGARPADLLVANVRSASATSATRGPTAARHSTARYVPRTRTRSSARWYCRRWAVGRSWCKIRERRDVQRPSQWPRVSARLAVGGAYPIALLASSSKFTAPPNPEIACD